MTAAKFKWEQLCSRCEGSCIDPDGGELVCDCCVDGMEDLGTMTEAEAQRYPNATKVEKP